MKVLLTAIAVAVTCLIAAPANAQTYPSRPVTVVVPFAAGGPADALARALGETLLVAREAAQRILAGVTGRGL